MQVASLQETHIFSPERAEHVARRLLARRLQSGSGAAGDISLPASLSCRARGPGGIVVGGGVTTTGLSGITSAGPNNAAGRLESPQSVHLSPTTCRSANGIHQISAGVWFQRVQDNEDTASRQLGQATFTSLTTFLQGTVSSFQVVPDANELGWRSLFGAWYVQDAIRLRRNLTIRVGHPRTSSPPAGTKRSGAPPITSPMPPASS